MLRESWEKHAKGSGSFLRESTASGLRVTISSTLRSLGYLTENVVLKYRMAAKTSQHLLESLFGIIS